MGSAKQLKLPIVDFSKDDLQPETVGWDMTRSEVRRALEEYGCFEAVFDEVPLELHQAIFSSLEELFDLPIETKIRNTSDKPNHGYIGPHAVSPLYESMGIDDATLIEGTQSFTNLMWPNGNSSFCETILSFSKRVSKLDRIVKRMVFESFGVEKYYDSCIKSNSYLLRVMKYKAPHETTLGVGLHTDKSLISILHQNQVNGLELQTKDGNWITVMPSASSFIVMVGEAFYAWSNSRLHCPTHQVKMSSGKDARYSLGLFSFSRNIIQVPEELVDEEHPLLFKPFDNIGLLQFDVKKMLKDAEFSVKAYCGLRPPFTLLYSNESV